MSTPRISPSFVVAVLALVVAAGGAGYAAGQVTSAEIKDGTIRSRDVADDGLSGADLRDRTVPRRKLSRSCPSGSEAAFGGCVARAATGPSSYQGAVDNCNRKNGRLPTISEVRWIAIHDEYGWADGNPSNYEFTGDWTDEYPVTPVGLDQSGFVISNASAQLFWHHCVVSY